MLLKSLPAVIHPLMCNAMTDLGPKLFKFGCGNPIVSNERQAYMGSAQSSPGGQAKLI